MSRKKENKEICKARISDAGGSFEERYRWFKKHRPVKKTSTPEEFRDYMLNIIEELYAESRKIKRDEQENE